MKDEMNLEFKEFKSAWLLCQYANDRDMEEVAICEGDGIFTLFFRKHPKENNE